MRMEFRCVQAAVGQQIQARIAAAVNLIFDCTPTRGPNIQARRAKMNINYSAYLKPSILTLPDVGRWPSLEVAVAVMGPRRREVLRAGEGSSIERFLVRIHVCGGICP